MRLPGDEAEEEAEEEAEAAAEAAAVAGGGLTQAVFRGFNAPPPSPSVSVAPRVTVPLAQFSSGESNGRADTPHDVAQTQFALKADVDVRSNPCLLSTRV